MMLKIYTASKLAKAQMWEELGKADHIFLSSRWLKHVKVGTPDSPDNAYYFWQENIDDVKECDRLVVYGTEDEHLRGALVEVGAALAFDKFVDVIGEHPDYGTWQFHPNIFHHKTIEDWLEHLRTRGDW
jgi:hypothetical protein